jgi:hypothetical protein
MKNRFIDHTQIPSRFIYHHMEEGGDQRATNEHATCQLDIFHKLNFMYTPKKFIII